VGRIWKILENQSGKRSKCYKLGLMGNSGGHSGNTYIVMEIWTGDFICSKYFVGNWTTGLSCYILTKNEFTLCLCPETLNKDELVTD
jgi:hypothetical protein